MLLFSLLFTACLDTFPTGKETTFVDNPTDDFDGDGQTEDQGDCNDDNDDIFLGSAEFDPDICGPDDDGDGFAPLEVGGTDCNDELSTVYPGAASYEPELCGSDFDGDGYAPLEYGGTDCDDTEALALPGGTEVCGDNIDNDCNGETDEPEASDATTWYLDADNDGYGVDNIITVQCEQPNAHAAQPGDCTDDNNLAYPGAAEFCDGYDNDCDGLVDDDDTEIQGDATWYLDADGDGFGVESIMLNQCYQPLGYVQQPIFDCDDSNPDVSPYALEICDGIDNNCDGLVDDDDGAVVPDKVWTVDSDGDGHGSSAPSATTLEQCEQPAGYSANANDCDDSTTAIGPHATEVCDGIDQDCDTIIDEGVQGPWFLDADNDGYGDPSVSPQYACLDAGPSGFVLDNTDCNDDASTAHPGADEICDGIDNDCNGINDENSAIDAPTWYLDADGDGFGNDASTFTSCVVPTGFVAENTDCDDGRDQVNPAMLETCLTAFDDDCDANNNDIDAVGCSDFFKDSDGDQYGDPNDTLCMCEADPVNDYDALNSADCDDSNGAIKPNTVENCDTIGVDDNCDGETNTIGGAFCTTFYYDYDGDGYGLDADRLCMCEDDGNYTALVGADCDDTTSLVSPEETEVCDELDVDENCDGVADGADAVSDGVNPGAVTWYLDADLDGYGDDTDADGDGTPDNIVVQCDQPVGHTSNNGDCNDSDPGMNPGEIEICNIDPVTLQHRDEDCSGSDNDPNDPLTSGCSHYFNDSDGDGYGVSGDTRCQCYPEGAYTSFLDSDCDDTTNTVSPAEIETCSTVGVDDNCNGTADEVNADGCSVYFYDGDDDFYGDGNQSRCACGPSEDWDATIGGDCDDGDFQVYYGQGCGLYGPVEASSGVYSLTFTDSTNAANTSTFDFNNDGINDMVISAKNFDTQYENAGALWVFLGPLNESVDLNTQDADLHYTPNVYNAQTGGRGLVVGNFDNDPHDEILSIQSNNSAFLIDNTALGQGVVNELSTGVSASSFRLPLGDVNDDGLGDELRGDSNDSQVNVQALDGSFALVGQEALNQDRNHSFVQNVVLYPDGTSLPVVASTDYVAYNNTNSVYLQRWDGGSMQKASRIAGFSDVGHFQHLSRGDFNNDGYDDLVVSDPYHGYQDPFVGWVGSAGRISVFYGSGTGFSLADDSLATDANWTMIGEIDQQNLGQYPMVADFDNDGKDDLLFRSIDAACVLNCYEIAPHLLYGDFVQMVDQSNAPIPSTIGQADAVIESNNSFLVPVGDQNNDGVDDVLVQEASFKYTLFHGVVTP